MFQNTRQTLASVFVLTEVRLSISLVLFQSEKLEVVFFSKIFRHVALQETREYETL